MGPGTTGDPVDTSEPVPGGALTPGQWGPLLDVIRSVEGGWESISGKSPIKGLTGWTIAEIAKSAPSYAGAYQLDPNSVIGWAKNVGLNPTDKFTPENQNKIAIGLIEGRAQGSKWVRGEISDTKFGNNLATIWAGLPVLSDINGKRRGNSYYAGVSWNKANTTPEKVESSLKKVKQGGYSQQELSINVTLPSTSQAQSLSRGAITSYFGSKESFRKKGHEGVDIGMNQETPLSFKMGGTILNAYRTSSREREAGGGYGSYMDVKLENGVILRLAHLSKIFPGSKFGPGNVVALSGGKPGYPGSGRSGGPHLHLEQHSAKLGAEETLKGKLDPVRYGGFGLVQTGGIVSRFHGGPVTKTGQLFAHKGEYVIDKDSVDLFGMNFIDSINRVENQSDLIAKAPSLIEKLKLISGYAPYEAEAQETVIVAMPPQMNNDNYEMDDSSGETFMAFGGGEDSDPFASLYKGT